MTSAAIHKNIEWKRKNGSSLVTVIILLLIMTITGVAILGVSMTENNTEIYQNRRTQAYYLAWSGANSVGDWVMKHPASSFSLDGKSALNTSDFANGEVEVEVSFDSATSQLLISSQGNVKGVTRMATLRLEQMSSNLMLDRAIYSNAPLDITGMIVSGDVQSGGNISYSTNGSNEFTGVAYPNEMRYYELVEFPTDLPLYGVSGVLSLKNEDLTILGTGYEFSTVTVWQNDTLTLQPTGVMKILVDDMTIDGNLNIDDTYGRVEIYVNNTLTVTTKGTINNEDPSDLIIYLKAGSIFYMQSNKVLNGYVIGPNATMEIQSAQSTTNGALITNIIRKNAQGQGPNGVVNYVPPDSNLDIDKMLISYRVLRWE